MREIVTREKSAFGNVQESADSTLVAYDIEDLEDDDNLYLAQFQFLYTKIETTSRFLQRQ